MKPARRELLAVEDRALGYADVAASEGSGIPMSLASARICGGVEGLQRYWKRNCSDVALGLRRLVKVAVGRKNPVQGPVDTLSVARGYARMQWREADAKPKFTPGKPANFRKFCHVTTTRFLMIVLLVAAIFSPSQALAEPAATLKSNKVNRHPVARPDKEEEQGPTKGSPEGAHDLFQLIKSASEKKPHEKK